MATLYLSERDFLTNVKKQKSKYHSAKTTLDGEIFDSNRESKRYAELLLLQRSGDITELQRQVPYVLIPVQREPSVIGPRGGVKEGRCIEEAVKYIADFVYKTRNGETIVEDAKGVRTPDYVIKRKLMLYVHKIRIKEV